MAYDAVLIPAERTPAEIKRAKAAVRPGVKGEAPMSQFVKAGLVQQAQTEYEGGTYWLLTPLHPGPFAPQYVPGMFRWEDGENGILVGTLLTDEDLDEVVGDDTSADRTRAAAGHYRKAAGLE